MNKRSLYVAGILISGLTWSGADQGMPAQGVPAQGVPAATQAAAPAASARVEKMAVGTAIDNKEISGEAIQFPGSVSRLYCWMKVSADQVPVTLKQVWSADGKQEAEVPLEIKYTSMRTWSSKNVWPGSWKVDVVDDKGTVLSSKEFTVTKEAAEAAPAAQPAAQPAPPAGQTGTK